MPAKIVAAILESCLTKPRFVRCYRESQSALGVQLRGEDGFDVGPARVKFDAHGATEKVLWATQEDTARWVDVFTRVFPPLLLLIIALFIGTIVVSMYMPIFELAGGLQ